MSIWGTFHEMKVHDAYTAHGYAGDPCECGDNIEVYLSSAWFGFPLRLSIDNAGTHADCALSRKQALQLADELQMWARRDEIGEIRMRLEYRELPAFTTKWDRRDAGFGETDADTCTFTCSCGESFNGTSTQVLNHLHTRHPDWCTT